MIMLLVGGVLFAAGFLMHTWFLWAVGALLMVFAGLGLLGKDKAKATSDEPPKPGEGGPNTGGMWH